MTATSDADKCLSQQDRGFHNRLGNLFNGMLNLQHLSSKLVDGYAAMISWLLEDWLAILISVTLLIL